MSYGPFVIAGYISTDTELVHPIRVQPETVAATFAGVVNVGTPSGISTSVSCVSRLGKREFGLGARTVTFRITAAGDSLLTEGTLHTLPVFSPTVWGGINRGQAVEYQGATGIVVSKSEEVAN